MIIYNRQMSYKQGVNCVGYSLQSQNASSENELETCKTQLSEEQKKNDYLIDMVMYMCSVHMFLYY